MTYLQEGQRVHVQTKNFSGLATILYIAQGEIYPVQVELDQGDGDGHRIQRIMSREIVHEPAEENAGISFNAPDDPQQYIGEVVDASHGFGFDLGAQYILGVIKYPGVYKPGPATSFYLYDPENKSFRGCMPGSMFKVIGPYEDCPDVTKEHKSLSNEPETFEKPVEAFIIPEEVNYQQMSLLDFL